MKVLVIYYSFEGNTRYIAEHVAKAVNGDLLELKPVNDIKTKGFMKYLWGGRQVVTGIKPEIQKIDTDINQYDLIFMGTPVWAFSYAPAMNTFLSNYKIEGKKIALFCCNGGGKGKTFVNFRQKLEGNDIVGEIEFIDPVKNVSEKAVKAQRWAMEMVGK